MAGRVPRARPRGPCGCRPSAVVVRRRSLVAAYPLGFGLSGAALALLVIVQVARPRVLEAPPERGFREWAV